MQFLWAKLILLYNKENLEHLNVFRRNFLAFLIFLCLTVCLQKNVIFYTPNITDIVCLLLNFPLIVQQTESKLGNTQNISVINKYKSYVFEKLLGQPLFYCVPDGKKILRCAKCQQI